MTQSEDQPFTYRGWGVICEQPTVASGPQQPGVALREKEQKLVLAVPGFRQIVPDRDARERQSQHDQTKGGDRPLILGTLTEQ